MTNLNFNTRRKQVTIIAKKIEMVKEVEKYCKTVKDKSL
jgi:hypothetical protein